APADGLFDPLTDALSRSVALRTLTPTCFPAGFTCISAISNAAFAYRDQRNHTVKSFEFVQAATVVIAGVCGARPRPQFVSLAYSPNHAQSFLALGISVRLAGREIHDEPVAVLHQDVHAMRELAFLPCGFASQACLGIGERAVRLVRAPFTPEVHRRIARIT